jgi:hypothetical protein
MTTLAAVAAANGAAVVLDLVPTGTISSITRSDANGNRAVRVPAGTFPRSTPLTLNDWEAALGSVVTYTVAGAPAATVTLTAEEPWFIAPLRPALSRSVSMVLDYGASRPSLGTIHQVIDRPDPLVALGRLATRAGTLTAWIPDYAEGRALEDMIDRSGVVLYKQHEHAGMDMYFTVTGTDLVPDSEDGWNLNIGYQEITAPTSPINEAVWTFGTVSTSFASFANVTSSYDDFEGLSLNDQTGVI